VMDIARSSLANWGSGSVVVFAREREGGMTSGDSTRTFVPTAASLEVMELRRPLDPMD
jgi:hypothetical protein